MKEFEMPSTEDVVKTLGVKSSGIRKPWYRRRKWLFVIILVLAYVFMKNGGNKAQGVHYVTQPSKIGNLVVTVSATGTLAPVKEVDVGSEVPVLLKPLRWIIMTK